MNRMRRAQLLCTVCVAFMGVALGSIIIPEPPPPPLGWEQEVTPGFEPSIESILVTHANFEPGELERLLEQWGPGAASVLIKRYRDARWKEFQPMIAKILARIPGEESRTFDFSEMLALLRLEQPSREETSAFSHLAVTFPDAFGDKEYEVLEEEFLKRAERTEVSTIEQGVLSSLCSLLAKISPEKGIPLLRERARTGHDKVRWACIIGLRNGGAPDALELEKLLAGETQDEEFREYLERRIDGQERARRAHEPMSIILERERREGMQ